MDLYGSDRQMVTSDIFQKYCRRDPRDKNSQIFNKHGKNESEIRINKNRRHFIRHHFNLYRKFYQDTDRIPGDSFSSKTYAIGILPALLPFIIVAGSVVKIKGHLGFFKGRDDVKKRWEYSIFNATETQKDEVIKDWHELENKHDKGPKFNYHVASLLLCMSSVAYWSRGHLNNDLQEDLDAMGWGSSIALSWSQASSDNTIKQRGATLALSTYHTDAIVLAFKGTTLDCFEECLSDAAFFRHSYKDEKCNDCNKDEKCSGCNKGEKCNVCNKVCYYHTYCDRKCGDSCFKVCGRKNPSERCDDTRIENPRNCNGTTTENPSEGRDDTRTENPRNCDGTTTENSSEGRDDTRIENPRNCDGTTIESPSKKCDGTCIKVCSRYLGPSECNHSCTMKCTSLDLPLKECKDGDKNKDKNECFKICNIHSRKECSDKCIKGCDRHVKYLAGEVHQGFYDLLFKPSSNFVANRFLFEGPGCAMELLMDRIFEDAMHRRLFYTENKSMHLWITGHSLGGALASLVMARLQTIVNENDPLIRGLSSVDQAFFKGYTVFDVMVYQYIKNYWRMYACTLCHQCDTEKWKDCKDCLHCKIVRTRNASIYDVCIVCKGLKGWWERGVKALSDGCSTCGGHEDRWDKRVECDYCSKGFDAYCGACDKVDCRFCKFKRNCKLCMEVRKSSLLILRDCYTFGSPKVGDTTFQQEFTKNQRSISKRRFSPAYWRIANEGDLGNAIVNHPL